MTYQINVIGAGRLGQHWLAALSSQDDIHIQQVVSRHLAASESNWPVVDSIDKLKSADITFLCVADDEIASAIEALARHSKIPHQSIFVHCAGSLSSDILSPLANLGALVASVHPLRAFTRQIDANAFHRCPVSLEGDPLAINQLIPLLQNLGAQPFVIDKYHKMLYHSACTLASNGLVGLAHAANKLFQTCRIDNRLANHLTLSLMSASLNNCHHNNHLLDALTGPIVRGDKHTVQSHLETLASHPDILMLYRQLSEQLLSLINAQDSLENWLEKDVNKSS
jgi:predicted short-subunit dehydrogenase-like oxidoreductase (DUF2520 family)